VTNPKALALVGKKYRTTADPAILEHAIAESEPPDFKQWTRAFTEVQSG